MKKWWIVLVLVAPMALAFAAQSAHDELVEMDKQWGEANLKGDTATLESILADDLMGVTPSGMTSKAQMLEAIEPSEETTYTASDYKVMMLGPDTAVMSHRGGGSDEPYGSLHVWAKRDGTWQVVATANVPIQSSSTNDE